MPKAALGTAWNQVYDSVSPESRGDFRVIEVSRVGETRIFAALENNTALPAIILDVAEADCPTNIEDGLIPAVECRACGPQAHRPGRIDLILQLRHPGFVKMFQPFAESVLESITVRRENVTPGQAVSIALRQWSEMFNPAPGGITSSRACELIAKLAVYRRLQQRLGLNAALNASLHAFEPRGTFVCQDRNIQVVWRASGETTPVPIRLEASGGRSDRGPLLLVVQELAPSTDERDKLFRHVEAAVNGNGSNVAETQRLLELLKAVGYDSLFYYMHRRRFRLGACVAYQLPPDYPVQGSTPWPEGAVECRWNMEPDALTRFAVEPDAVIGELVPGKEIPF